MSPWNGIVRLDAGGMRVFGDSDTYIDRHTCEALGGRLPQLGGRLSILRERRWWQDVESGQEIRPTSRVEAQAMSMR
jgi:hypothetical protein